MNKDPVCGMEVEPETAPARHAHDGVTYYFCSEHCHDSFTADPNRYLAEKAPPPSASEGAIYTCPMHPEVRQQGPGSCPQCGMSLEPLGVPAAAKTEYT